MRHIYFRGVVAIVWGVAAVISAMNGDYSKLGLYGLLMGTFIVSAYSMWKKEKKNRGENK